MQNQKFNRHEFRRFMEQMHNGELTTRPQWDNFKLYASRIGWFSAIKEFVWLSLTFRTFEYLDHGALFVRR